MAGPAILPHMLSGDAQVVTDRLKALVTREMADNSKRIGKKTILA
jgi:hypothetical protein